MTTAIFVTHFVPSDVGHGGNHRAYQILHDLKLAVGENNVELISFPRWEQERGSVRHDPNLCACIARDVKRRVAYYRENPARVFANTIYSPKRFSIPDFLTYYRHIIKEIPRPAVCIIEHTGFTDLIRLNSQYGIHTISCIENLESFDTAILKNRSRHDMLARVVDFANEFHILAQCTERLFISKVEAGLIGGLGLSAQYYPYLPVGLIRQRLELIRRSRRTAPIERGLFLLLGTAGHNTTREAFLWFVRQAYTYGLPNGVRVVVAGWKTDSLLSPGVQVPGLEVKGFLEQDELDRLMMSAQAVLVPQRAGFGALTRFSELSCAGIPCIVSKHPTYAVDLPPGIEVVSDEWVAWYEAMEQFIKNDRRIHARYRTWERNQPRTLETLMGRLLRSVS